MLEIAVVPGVGHVAGKQRLAFCGFVAEEAAQVTGVGCVHVVDVVKMGKVCLRNAAGAAMVIGHAVLIQLGACRGIDGVSLFLVTDSDGGDLKFVGASGFADKVFHNEFRHGASANIPVADEKYFDHGFSSLSHHIVAQIVGDCNAFPSGEGGAAAAVTEEVDLSHRKRSPPNVLGALATGKRLI